MPLFSEEISEKSPAVRRHLYESFRDAVKTGQIEALRLLTKFRLPKVRGGEKEVFDYAYTTKTRMVVGSWIIANEKLPTKGVTAEQVQDMSDEELQALIKQQNKAKKPSKKRITKAIQPKPKGQKIPKNKATKSTKKEGVKSEPVPTLSEETMKQLRANSEKEAE